MGKLVGEEIAAPLLRQINYGGEKLAGNAEELSGGFGSTVAEAVEQIRELLRGMRSKNNAGPSTSPQSTCDQVATFPVVLGGRKKSAAPPGLQPREPELDFTVITRRRSFKQENQPHSAENQNAENETQVDELWGFGLWDTLDSLSRENNYT